MSGFKSFVDKTELPILDGLTGIVGPNGCGKSNILDAIQWVMGETRPKSMRSGGMEDVIFAGAGSRPAKSTAEVSLMLDNSDFLAPEEYNKDKNIEIVRKVARDLGSQFKVNGKEFRARDIQILFADASSGAQSNSLVKQGQVTELINAKPRDRRRILEEAAGISGLYQRRHEAELKLANTELNLSRVSDVIDQLDSQIKTLERQARQAKRYKDLGIKIRELESILLYLKLTSCSEQMVKSENELTNIFSDLAKKVELASRETNNRIKLEAEIKPLRSSEARFSGELANNVAQVNALEEQESIAFSSIKSIEENIKELILNQERERKLLNDAKLEKLKLDDEKKELANTVLDIKREEDLQAKLEEVEATLSNSEKSLEEFGDKFVRLEERLDAFDINLNKKDKQAKQLKADLADLKSNRKVNLDTIRQKKESIEVNKQQLAKLSKEFEASNTKYKSHVSDMELAFQKLENLKIKASELEGEQSFIESECSFLENSVFESKKNDNQLLDNLEIEEDYVKAISAILEDELEYPQIEVDYKSGWRNMETISLPSLPGNIPGLDELMDSPEVLKPRFKSIGFVSNELGPKLQPLLKVGQTLVSKEGNFWRWDGFVKNDKTVASPSAINLDRRNKLKIAQNKLVDLNLSLASTKGQFSEASERCRQVTEMGKDIKNQASHLQNEMENLRLYIVRQASELNILSDKQNVIEESISIKEKDINSFIETEDHLSIRQHLVSELNEAKISYENMKLKVEHLRLEYREKKTAFDQINLKRLSQEIKAKEVDLAYEGWSKRLLEAQDREKEIKSRHQSLDADLKTAKAKPNILKEKKSLLNAAISEIKKNHLQASKALELAEQNLRLCFDKEKKFENEVSDLREKRATTEANKANVKEKLEYIKNEIDETFGNSYKILVSKMTDKKDQFPSTEEAEENISLLKRKRESLGAVNLRAEEDSSELLSQFSNLNAEKDDLSKALLKLSSGISDLNKEGRERLKSAFDEVNKNFKSLFKELFGGGEATLTLVESSDPLEAGLEIFCQPPGKKLSTISLLSGGEQTLTALSLIFAVFMANPSPICILDEVDAPLDDSNTLKFCSLLSEMVRKTDTRFLVVTHNSITMSKMDRLLGVTMVEKGVSQLVSVSLGSAEEFAANVS